MIFKLAPLIGETLKKLSPIKVMLIDGQNNHDWKSCSPVMMDTLEVTGRFVVQRITVTQDAVSEFSPDFDEYDVILSNYNGLSWPTETKKSFVKYIQNGGNLVVIHAADNSFPDACKLSCARRCHRGHRDDTRRVAIGVRQPAERAASRSGH